MTKNVSLPNLLVKLRKLYELTGRRRKKLPNDAFARFLGVSEATSYMYVLGGDNFAGCERIDKKNFEITESAVKLMNGLDQIQDGLVRHALNDVEFLKIVRHFRNRRPRDAELIKFITGEPASKIVRVPPGITKQIHNYNQTADMLDAFGFYNFDDYDIDEEPERIPDMELANDNVTPSGADPQPKPNPQPRKKSIKLDRETKTPADKIKRRAKKSQKDEPSFIDFLPAHERATYRDFNNRINALMREIHKMEERYPVAIAELNELLHDRADFVFRMKKLYEPNHDDN